MTGGGNEGSGREGHARTAEIVDLLSIGEKKNPGHFLYS